mmetsp:Transcript_35695/g.79387  ORF Transcript_35695/g.79387 Transcript_35695/m.79387 type:complete len:1131 (+) Transcript_35695:131-3523(+)
MDVSMEDATADNNLLIEAVPDPPEAMDAEIPAIQETGSNGEQKQVDDELCGTHEWKVENFSKLADKVYSNPFEIAQYQWRLLLFPKGNNKAPQLSVYLDFPEAPYTPVQMSPKASFKLHLLNQLDPTKSFSKDTAHTFTQHESDWGFTQFMPLDDLKDPQNGYVVNDTIILRVEIQVQRDERYSYDSRKETGHVGLKNQGATCYMNSLLQYLYHLPYFRKAVYHMPTNENDEASKSLPLALQSLFYKLQYSNTSVSTKDLTKSFGWGTYDAFMQHDVQELNRVLCEKLEEKMKGTRVEKVINELFEGHTTNYIECINVDYKSSRDESFMDLQLDVKGCKDIYESFEKYCEVEIMDGPNQYKAEGHGLQDARKGVLFKDMPPVLQLQLKRFEYDFQRDTNIKINDRYEFYEEIDLDFQERKTFTKDADKGVSNQYRLHSVLVHSGGVHGGHYYAFIRPDGKTWLKFDDDRVTIESKEKALDEQFGGEDDTLSANTGYNNAPVRYTKYSNAYMLVYIRVSDWDRIVCNVTKDDIAPHLRDRLEQEQREKEQRQKEKREAHLYATLKVATDEDLYTQIGSSQQYFDLINHDRLGADRIFRVRKNTKFQDFKALVAERLGVPQEKQRWWTWARRQNATFRPSRPLTPQEEDSIVLELREHREQGAPATKHAIMDLKLFLEVPITHSKERLRWEYDPSKELLARAKHDILVFFKFYDPKTEELRHVGRAYLHKNTKLLEVMVSLNKTIGLPEATELEYFEEIKYEPSVMVDRIDKKQSLGPGAQIEDGDIIIVQRAMSDQEAKQYRFPLVGQFLTYIRDRRLVTFKRLEEPKEEGLQLELLREMSYDQVTAKLAEKLQLEDPTRLRLTQHNVYSHAPQRNPLKFGHLGKLENMLMHAAHTTDVLYYEVLDMPLNELEQLKTLRVFLYNDKAEQASEHTVRLPKNSTVGDVLVELQKQAGAAAAGRPLRLLEVYNSKIYKICDPGENIEQMNDAYWQLRAEAIPEDQLQEVEGGRLIHVYHFNQDKENAAHLTNFGDPFLLLIRDDEPLSDIKHRVQAKLGVADEEFSKWQFAFVSIRSPPEYLTDGDIVGERFAKAQHGQASEVNYLGLQHEDKAPRRPNNTYRMTYERPVKIYT